jgi:glycosyltransferase involved in cell wall biosynthesis
VDAQSSQLAHSRQPPHRPIRLLFDGRKIGDGGIGVYIDNTIRGLLALGDVEIAVISPRRKANQVSWQHDVVWIYDETKPYSVGEYVFLGRRMQPAFFDVFHSPHYTLPFALPIPSVVTIHDLIHIEQPQSFYYPFVARRLVRSALKRADAIIAVSEATKRALVQLSPGVSERVAVIPNAIPSYLEETHRSCITSERVQALIKDGPFFLAVLSNAKPHKGILDLVRAYSEVARASNTPRLILAGYGTRALNNDRQLVELVAATPALVALGEVEDEELRALYKAADSVIIPSLAEGFCLPALEAKSVGTRVVCRPIPAVRELVSSNDIIAEDHSCAALAEAIQTAAARPCAAKSVDVGFHERFSAQRIAHQLREVYSKVTHMSPHFAAAVGGIR